MTADSEEVLQPSKRGSSGRRRWEVQSKESFECTLAVETPSPVIHANRAVTSLRHSHVPPSVMDPNAVYGARMSGGNGASESISRAKSAGRRPSAKSRESSAETKHTQKMAEGRRARAASVLSDKHLLNEKQSSKSGKVPVLYPRTSSRNSGQSSNENLLVDISKSETNKQVIVTPDSLSTKLSAILNTAVLQKLPRPSSQDTNYSEETVSREEGYESDDAKFNKIQTDHKVHKTPRKPIASTNNTEASAPPYEDAEIDDKLNGSNFLQKLSSSQSESTSPIPRKTRRRPRRSCSPAVHPDGVQHKDSYIGLQLRKLREDIIQSNTVDHNRQFSDSGQFGSDATSANFMALPGIILANEHARIRMNDSDRLSAAVNTIYCEKMHGFVLAKSGSKYLGNLALIESHSSERIQPQSGCSRASLAVCLQTILRTFAVFAQGLLAGLTLAHCLTVFLLAKSWQDVSAALPPLLTHVFYALVVTLTAVCFVAACDRCDLCSSSGGLVSHHSLHIPWSAGLYLASLSITLASTRSEVLLAHRHIADLPSPHQSGGIGWYAWLCLARAVANLLAWLVVVPDPHTDALLSRLNEALQAENEESEA